MSGQASVMKRFLQEVSPAPRRSLVLQLRLAACSDSLGYRREGGSSHDGSRVDGDPDRLEGLPQGVAGETGASLRAGRDALVSLSVHRGAALAGGTQDRVDAG